MATTYVTDEDLREALGLSTYVALFDDLNQFDAQTGLATAQMSEAVDRIIRRAAARTTAWLPLNHRGTIPPPDPVPELLKELALLYAEALAWKRKPDYLVSQKMEPSVKDMLKEADQMGQRIQSAILQLHDADVPTPANVGGIITSGDPSFMIDSPDGTSNAGDF